MKKRGLGKGLSDMGLGALLSEIPAVNPPAPSAIPRDHLNTLPIDAIQPGAYQPRKTIAPDALEELTQSIRAQGVIQPIIVRPLNDNQYELIAGERRWRAAQAAGLTTIPAIVRALSDEAAMVIGLIENIQRRDLNVMEEALSLNRLLTEFQLTHQQIADAVGKSRTNITNVLRLLKLPNDVQTLLQQGQLEMGHARALLPLDENQQSLLATKIIANQLSVRETEQLVRDLTNPASTTPKKPKLVLHDLQNQLRAQLGMKVNISKNADGQGKMLIHYENDDELHVLMEKLS